MSDLQSTLEFSVELNKFYNVDLFQRGYYQIRCDLKCCQKLSAKIEVGLPRSKEKDAIRPPCIINGTAVSKTFQIMYRNEEVILEDVIQFRVHLLVDSARIEETLQNAEFELELSLWFTDDITVLDTGSQRVSARTLKLDFLSAKGLHYSVPVLFDYFHLSAISITVHGVLLSIHQPYLPSPRASHKKNRARHSTGSTNLSTMETVLFGQSQLSVKYGTLRTRLAIACSIYQVVCTILLQALEGLQEAVEHLNGLLPDVQKGSLKMIDCKKRLKTLSEVAKTLDNEDDFLLRANSDISQLCAQNVLLWNKFLDLFTLRDSVRIHLSEMHHNHRVRRFAEGFFTMSNPRKSLLCCLDAKHQHYLAVSEAVRKSEYFQTLPNLQIHCKELDGDPSTLPIIFEDIYCDGVPIRNSCCDNRRLYTGCILVPSGQAQWNNSSDNCDNREDDKDYLVDVDSKVAAGRSTRGSWSSSGGSDHTKASQSSLDQLKRDLKEIMKGNGPKHNAESRHKQRKLSTDLLSSSVDSVNRQRKKKISLPAKFSRGNSSDSMRFSNTCSSPPSTHSHNPSLQFPLPKKKSFGSCRSSSSAGSGSYDESSASSGGERSLRSPTPSTHSATIVESVSSGFIKDKFLINPSNIKLELRRKLSKDKLDKVKLNRESTVGGSGSDAALQSAGYKKGRSGYSHLECCSRLPYNLEEEPDVPDSLKQTAGRDGSADERQSACVGNGQHHNRPGDEAETQAKTQRRPDLVTLADPQMQEDSDPCCRSPAQLTYIGSEVDSTSGLMVSTNSTASINKGDSVDGSCLKMDSLHGSIGVATTPSQPQQAGQSNCKNAATTDTEVQLINGNHDCGQQNQISQGEKEDCDSGSHQRPPSSSIERTKQTAETSEAVETNKNPKHPLPPKEFRDPSPTLSGSHLDARARDISSSQLESSHMSSPNSKLSSLSESPVGSPRRRDPASPLRNVIEHRGSADNGEPRHRPQVVATNGVRHSGLHIAECEDETGVEPVVISFYPPNERSPTRNSVQLQDSESVPNSVKINENAHKRNITEESQEAIDRLYEAVSNIGSALSSNSSQHFSRSEVGKKDLDQGTGSSADGGMSNRTATTVSDEAKMSRSNTISFGEDNLLNNTHNRLRCSSNVEKPRTETIRRRMQNSLDSALSQRLSSSLQFIDRKQKESFLVEGTEMNEGECLEQKSIKHQQVVLVDSSNFGFTCCDWLPNKLSLKDDKLLKKIEYLIGSKPIIFVRAREEFKRLTSFPGSLYSDFPIRYTVPYFTLCTNPSQSLAMQANLHLVVCVHGLDGNAADLRLVKTYLEIALPSANLEFLMSEINQTDTFLSLEDMTTKLVEEILFYVRCLAKSVSRISFIGHSLGCILIRSAITRPELAAMSGKFYTFLSLSGPHLGTLYNNSGLVNAGMWMMQKWKKSGSLQQLALKDCTDIRDTFLYQLSARSNLHKFRHVLLAGSSQDKYVPIHSARIELCKAAVKDQSITGTAYREMVYNILEPLVDGDTELVRYDIHHALPNNTNSLIGRAAHIAVLDSELFIEKFLVVVALKYFQ